MHSPTDHLNNITSKMNGHASYDKLKHDDEPLSVQPIRFLSMITLAACFGST